MAVIRDIPLFAVGTADELLTVSNSGLVLLDDSRGFGTQDLRVTNAASVNSVFNRSTTHTYCYAATETPGSANQKVRIRVQRRTHNTTSQWYAIARANSNHFIAAMFTGQSRRVSLIKCISGTRTTVASSDDNTRLPNALDEGDLQVEVSGTAPTISARVLWNGVEVIAPQTLTETQLNPVGQVGFWQRNFDLDGQTAGYHITRFYAEDDTSAAANGRLTGPALTNSILNGRLTA